MESEKKKVSYDLIIKNLEKKFYKEIGSESSRGFVIISICYLEWLLLGLLLKRLVDEKEALKILANKKRPIGFSRKIDLCYLVDVIYKEERDDLKTLNKIRNKFAHSWGITFNNEEIKKELCELKILKVIGLTYNFIKENPEDSFRRAILILIQLITLRISNCERISNQVKTLNIYDENIHSDDIIRTLSSQKSD